MGVNPAGRESGGMHAFVTAATFPVRLALYCVLPAPPTRPMAAPISSAKSRQGER